MSFHITAMLMTANFSSPFPLLRRSCFCRYLRISGISSWTAAPQLKLNPSDIEHIPGDASPCQDLVIFLINPEI